MGGAMKKPSGTIALSPIVIGLGANLPSTYGSPRATCEAALAEFECRGLRIVARSPWYESAPVPISDQPWYVNGVVEVATELEPVPLLALLHEIEREFGRVRREVNAARILDLDLLAYGDLVREGPEPPLLPHPRLAERAFVLLPLADLRPDWRHPATGESIRALIARLPADQVTRRLPPGKAAAAPRRSAE
jgi:2-amino-4-hydroxy-6-hydroxymethyldihydropteridine diphosphokinase